MHLAVPLYTQARICPLHSAATYKPRQIHFDISHSVSLFATRVYAVEASPRFILSFRSIRSPTSPSWFSDPQRVDAQIHTCTQACTQADIGRLPGPGQRVVQYVPIESKA